MRVAGEPDVGAELHALAAELFPINRSLAGPGFRATLDRLERVSGPMERHRFASGDAVFDWTVPPEWDVREAWVRGPDGETVVDFADHNLHLVGYSASVDVRLSLEDLQAHLHSLPEQPEAIPYRTSYYHDGWGFCLPDRRREALRPGTYHAFIDAVKEPGTLEVGEVVVEGTGAGEVLLSTYCCHPSMANNELSGPVIVAGLARRLRERATPPRHTYRLLFVPETIGAIAYLSRFGERLRDRLVAGWVVTCAGDPGPVHYKRSRRGDTAADRVAEHVLEHYDGPSQVLPFVPVGSDERQWCSPGFDLPVGSLMRTPYHRYPEYHTSLDDLELITPEALGTTYELYGAMLEALEANEVFTATMPYGEPQLGRRGLYPTTGGPTHAAQRLHDMLYVLNACDGTVDLLAVAERYGRPIAALRDAADVLERHGLLRR